MPGSAYYFFKKLIIRIISGVCSACKVTAWAGTELWIMTEEWGKQQDYKYPSFWLWLCGAAELSKEKGSKLVGRGRDDPSNVERPGAGPGSLSPLLGRNREPGEKLLLWATSRLEHKGPRPHAELLWFSDCGCSSSGQLIPVYSAGIQIGRPASKTGERRIF